MSEALENKLKSLNDLNNLRKELKAKTIDRRLTELNLFDRTSKLFAPIVNVVEKQNENLEVLKNNLTSNNIQRTLPSSELFKSIKDHSMFIPIEESNGEIFFKLKNRDAPQLKFNKNSKELTIFPNDGSQEIKTKINEGTKTLLFDIHPNTSIITGEDFNEYLKIYEIIGDKPGAGHRIKNIINTKSNIDALNLLLSNFNKNSKLVKQTNLPTLGKGLVDSNEKIMKRLGVLSSAYKAGHTNVFKEMTAILDDLLERKIITKRQYREFIN